MKINFQKIASVLTSAVMLSSTIGLAAAANYPAPFVKSGASDVAVVWGSTAQASDLVAVTDITADLQAELASQTASTSGSSSSTSVEGGDFVKIAKSSDQLNLGNTMSGVFGTTVSDDDLPVLLGDGTYSNDENTEYDYEQTISLAALTLSHFSDSDYNDKEPTIGFSIAASTHVMTYTLDFTTDAESDVVSSDLVDLETTDINILGKTYYILDAKNGTSSGAAGTAFGKFTLLDSANTAIVSEGETQTVAVGDTDHEVGINFIGESSVKLDIDGQVTNSLAEGETFKLSDGTYVGIKDILYSSKTGGVSKVEFSIGTGKLEIENGQDVELNDDDIDGVMGNFTRASASSSGKEKVDKLTLQWLTDDQEFLTSEKDLDMPGFGAVKFSMGEFYTPTQEVIKVENDGDDSISVSVPIKDGTAEFNLLYANASGEFAGLGSAADERLVTSNATTLMYNATSGGDKWFVVSWNSSADAESYLLSASVTDDGTRNRTTIRNEVTNSDVCSDKAVGDTCNIGSASLTITQVNKSGSIRTDIFTAGSGTTFNTLYTKGGLKMYLPYIAANGSTTKGAVNFSTLNGNEQNTGHNYDTFWLFFDEENKDDTLAAGASFNLTLNDNTDGDVEVSDINSGQAEYEVEESDTFETYVKSDLATKLDVMKSGDQDTAEIEYHAGESYADVYLTAVGATVSEDGSSTSSGGSVKKLGSVAVSDAEISSVSTKNLIVVGGSCVNSVAAELLGGALCGANFEGKTGASAGQFVIETFARSGGKVATLVAGYNAADTTNAAKYLTTQTVDTTVGKKYVGTSSTSAELVTESASA